jgi:hypothetical protein
MVEWPVVAAASFAVAVSTAMAVRPRRMLQFRSPGRIEPGSIPRWHVAVWRGIAVTVTVGGLILISIAISSP